MVSTLRKFAALGLAAAAAVAALGGCVTETKVWSYDEEAEAGQGLQQHEAIVAQVGIYPDEDLSRYVTAVGGKLAAASERPGLTWRFTVLDSPRPRVFATRGGYVYVTRGMLALLRSENDLAAILAHEISHISTRDAVRAEVRGNITDVGGVATSVAFPFETFLVSPYARAFAPMRVAAFNSSEELEADRRGAENLRRAEYPEESMAAVMEVFAVIEAHDNENRRTVDPHRQDRRYAIYADYLSPMSVASEVFNRDYGRGFPNVLYRCFADDPNPYTRQFKLRHKTLFSTLFPGNAPDQGAGGRMTADPIFLARLDGLEVGPSRSAGVSRLVLRVRQVQEGDTFASLARTAPVPEVVLRLLNQRYPSGELVPGQLVKVIE